MPQTIASNIVPLFQIIIAFGLINVWLVRFNKPTKYRGAGAANMTDEFAAYGLPKWFMYMVGAGKILIAALMIFGFWVPAVIYPASVLLAVLMVGAVSMHIKVKDPFVRSVPAMLILLMAFINIVSLRPALNDINNNIIIPPSPIPQQSTVEISYMCNGVVRVEEEQDSPSLPPRISYIRERDNVEVAYYGDMGAYIRPEYFSIDRKQIEEGYSFNEINFCKYLKK
jgi:hypothetical protein